MRKGGREGREASEVVCVEVWEEAVRRFRAERRGERRGGGGIRGENGGKTR